MAHNEDIEFLFKMQGTIAYILGWGKLFCFKLSCYGNWGTEQKCAYVAVRNSRRTQGEGTRLMM
jgi:hypothetical protein